jgi:hypothetical protein
MQSPPRRGQHVEVGAGGDQLTDNRGNGSDEMLAVIEDEQQLAIGNSRPEGGHVPLSFGS